MKLNQAISGRLTELLKEKQMTQYQLFIKSGVPKSTIGNVINCSYDSVKLRVIHEMCQGLGISISEFFDSPLFQEGNLDPEGSGAVMRRSLFFWVRSRGCIPGTPSRRASRPPRHAIRFRLWRHTGRSCPAQAG